MTNLKKKISVAAPEVKMADRGRVARKEVVHIKDLDIEATKEEVVLAVRKKLGDTIAAVVTSARPAFGSTQNAKVVMPVKEGQIFVSSGRLLVGWQSFPVEIRQ